MEHATPQTLAAEAFKHRALAERLKAAFPDLDEQTLCDTVEGLTNLHERLKRIQHRAFTKRELALGAIEQAGLKRLELPDFTVSRRQLPPQIVVQDESLIPPDYWEPQPARLQRRKLLADLRGGGRVPGATLDNGGITIAVKTR